MSPKKTKAGKRQAAAAVATTPSKKMKKQKDESEEDSSEEEMEVEPVKTKAGKKATPAKKPAKEESSSEDSSSDEDATPKAAQNGKAKKAPAKKEESSDDSSDDSSDEEPAKPSPAKKAKQAKKAAPKEESSDEEDSSEEESAKPSPAKKAKQAKKAAPKEESSDEEEDSSEEEEAPKVKSAKKATKEESDESEDEDEEKSEEEEAKEEKSEEPLTLFVGNLPEVDEEKITKFFKKNGINIIEIRKNPSKPFCHIDVESKGDMEKALELNESDFKGNAIRVDKTRKPGEKPKQERKSLGGDDDNVKLFVKNVGQDVDNDMMQEVFSDAVSIRIAQDSDGNNKGFAFLTFSSEDQVQSAVDNLQGTEVGGQALFLDFCGSKSTFKKDGGRGAGRGGGRGGRGGSSAEPGKTKILFVKNLSYNVDRDTLREYFESSTSARVAWDRESDRSRGFGFVEFDTPEDAVSAHKAMQGAEIDGRSIFLDFASESGGGGGGGRGGRGGRGGFGGRGGGRGRGGFGDRGGRGRGGRGGGRGGFRGAKTGIQEFRGSKKSFDD